MTLRPGLRLKILLITVLLPLALGVTAFLTVHRNVQAHVDSSSIHESLQHAVWVFEGMLAARGKVLAGGGEVIARDPRFFSMLMLGADQRDPYFKATLRDMAHDFNGITQTELFEVFDRRGRRLASVGSSRSEKGTHEALVREAFLGRHVDRVVAQGRDLYQVSVTPMRGDGRIIGALLLGSAIDQGLARVLRNEMRSDVTFVSAGQISGTTLDHAGDRRAIVDKVASLELRSESSLRTHGPFKIRGQSATYVAVLGRIPGSDTTGTQLYVMQRSFDPELQFLQSMQKNLLLLGGVAVVAALVIGLIFSDRLTRPITELVRGAQEMQRGNYAHPMAVRSTDEIGYLAERFLEMRQREQVYVHSLEEAANLKSKFITIVSHEIRTPISAIQGYRDLLEMGGLGPLDEPQKEALTAMKSHLRDLTRIAEQATQVAQLQGERLQLNLAPQSIVPIVQRAVGTALAAAPLRKVKVETNVDVAIDPVRVDGELLAQALISLVSNGIRFTRDGGRILIVVCEREEQLEIEVLDEGPGIPEDRLGHVFDHGFSIHNPLHHHSSSELEFESRGLGLGLAIARAIAEAHSGTIDVTNRPEGGSSFRIRIPCLEEPESKSAA